MGRARKSSKELTCPMIYKSSWKSVIALEFIYIGQNNIILNASGDGKMHIKDGIYWWKDQTFSCHWGRERQRSDSTERDASSGTRSISMQVQKVWFSSVIEKGHDYNQKIHDDSFEGHC